LRNDVRAIESLWIRPRPCWSIPQRREEREFIAQFTALHAVDSARASGVGSGCGIAVAHTGRGTPHGRADDAAQRDLRHRISTQGEATHRTGYFAVKSHAGNSGNGASRSHCHRAIACLPAGSAAVTTTGARMPEEAWPIHFGGSAPIPEASWRRFPASWNGHWPAAPWRRYPLSTPVHPATRRTDPARIDGARAAGHRGNTVFYGLEKK
jgi:hypothetical protein